ncbi:basic amino acid ABC transporter substrate-binding protein [Vallitalea okinawensis]|uniref:basic amino acid ABC transporter substrate-binding protein n=1 Tax=Vallitalea okinawensis TaxID=2078660 RepID=UPI000CFD2632|nr:basic amino acid ABC transporter substrate-binding protein [Vallitalea okinawensis]
MKKSMLSFIILIIGLFTLAGCSATNASVEEKETVVEKEAEKKEEKTNEDEVTTIVMGTNAEFAPFEYMSGNKVVGFDIDISEAIASTIDKELVIENMAFDSLIPALQAGKVDFVAAGLTVTEERKQHVDFSDPYFVSTQVIIKLADNTEINGPDDLVNKKIGAQIGTTGEMLAKDIEGSDVQSFNAGYAAVMDLMNGKVDAVVIDQEPAKKLIANNEGTVILDEALSHEEYAIAVPKGNEELLKAVNDTLKTIKEDGTYDEFYNQYFKDASVE